MVIEQLVEQDLNKLEEKVRIAYYYIYEKHSCVCNSCKTKNFVSYTSWSPSNNISDAWKCLEIMRQWGYIGMSHDSVLYTFTVNLSDCQEPRKENILSGDGISPQQAICNLFVKFYDWIVARYEK